MADVYLKTWYYTTEEDDEDDESYGSSDNEYESSEDESDESEDGWIEVKKPVKERKVPLCVIGNKKYFSTTPIIKRAQRLRDQKLEVDEMFQSGFLQELLKLHPRYEEKIAGGIQGFFVAPSVDHPDTACFWIVHDDESTVQFGIHACLRDLK